MEHIVQFGINLDDEAIMRSIVTQAAVECRKAIEEVRGNSYYDKDGIKSIIEYEAGIQISRFIKENSEEIISRAVKEVANSLTRTKAFREAAGSLADEIREKES